MAAVGGSKRAVSRGLARPSEPESGELIVYSTRENDVADDGSDGHSPFTAAFLQHLPEPGLEVNFLFRKIRSSVLKATNGGQDPAIYASLSDSQLYFVDPPAAKPAGNETAPGAAPSLSPDAQAWMAVQGSKSEAVLEEFIRRFPGGVYANFARARLEELKRSKTSSRSGAAAAPAAETLAEKCSKQRHCHRCPQPDRAACQELRRKEKLERRNARDARAPER
jgi:Caspase domain